MISISEDKLCQRCCRFLEFLELHGKFTQSVKFACKYAGLPTGSVRPPLQPLSEQEQESLTGLITEMKSSIDQILSGQGKQIVHTNSLCSTLKTRTNFREVQISDNAGLSIPLFE